MYLVQRSWVQYSVLQKNQSLHPPNGFQLLPAEACVAGTLRIARYLLGMFCWLRRNTGVVRQWGVGHGRGQLTWHGGLSLRPAGWQPLGQGTEGCGKLQDHIALPALERVSQSILCRLGALPGSTLSLCAAPQNGTSFCPTSQCPGPSREHLVHRSWSQQVSRPL